MRRDKYSLMPENPLARYWSVLDHSSEARYLDSKRRLVEADLDAETDDLWQAHRKALMSHDDRGRISLLDLKIELAKRILSECTLCERRCRVDRNRGETGHCGVADSRISSAFLHMGEEPELTPSHTIFFSGCTFNCVFCQNWDISTAPDSGLRMAPSDLARLIEARVAKASTVAAEIRDSMVARNVNWVGGDPTSHILLILQTLKGCDASIPQVWNSNMYQTIETMNLLDGVIDLYLTDFKYGNDDCAARLSKVKNYTAIVQRNHLLARSNAEMIVRHLVLPSHIDCCTRPALSWIARNLQSVKVNVMAQYRPEHKAREHKDISRSLSSSEYEEALAIADELGLDLCD